VVRYKNEIHALLVVLFPEFTQVAVRSHAAYGFGGPQALSKRTGHRANRGGVPEPRSCMNWHRVIMDVRLPKR
jgi:hypothetical protein